MRVLDYYPGILFLTTNRVGIFDEAFKSRIHMALYYPPLAKQAFLDIIGVNLYYPHEGPRSHIYSIEMNLKRARDIDPDLKIKRTDIMEYVDISYTTLKWNGRQIRNAVHGQTAMTLAKFGADTKVAGQDPSKTGIPRARIVLNRSHFKKVAKAPQEFDHYTSEIYCGHDDTDLAKTISCELIECTWRNQYPTQFPTTAIPHFPQTLMLKDDFQKVSFSLVKMRIPVVLEVRTTPRILAKNRRSRIGERLGRRSRIRRIRRRIGRRIK